jgi:hypothetical protein
MARVTVEGCKEENASNQNAQLIDNEAYQVMRRNYLQKDPLAGATT